MNPAITQESMKAVGILIAAFLTSIIVASFFYLQPGQAQASDEPCTTHGIVEDINAAEGLLRVTVEASPGCPRNDIFLYAVSEDGITTVLDSNEPTINKDGSYTAQIEFALSKYVDGYVVQIEDAFSASIIP